MSLTLKLSSLAVRTLAKPIANYIKGQAREHEKFRKICINFAQHLHRFDMRMRLGLLQDPAVIERQIQREAEQEAKRKRQQEEKRRERQSRPLVATAKTEAEANAEKEELERDLHKIEEKVKKEKEASQRQRIRPLSEAKAIDSGATFISETFLFFVAAGLIVAETLRRGGKEKDRQADVAERLDQLEGEVKRAGEIEDHLRDQVQTLEAEVRRLSPVTGETTATTDDSVKSVSENDGKSPQNQQSKTTAG